MAKSKKYDYRVIPAKSGWAVEILRRVTAKESVVSKFKDGFVCENEAQAWGEEALKSFLSSLSERNKRRAVRRESGPEEENG